MSDNIGSARTAKARLLWLRDGGEWELVQEGDYYILKIPFGPMRLLTLRRPVYRWTFGGSQA